MNIPMLLFCLAWCCLACLLLAVSFITMLQGKFVDRSRAPMHTHSMADPAGGKLYMAMRRSAILDMLCHAVNFSG